MEKKVFYAELSYVFGLVIIAFGSALLAKADFGVAMVVAPAYILHLKLSQFLPWFSFGVAEYCLQGLLVLLTALLVRRFKLSYLFSFVTAVLYGTLLDLFIKLVAYFPTDIFLLRIVWFVLGDTLCAFAVSLFFHTYISPEAYELIVKELSAKFGWNINRVKTCFDCICTLIGIVMSFAFFGFGVFEGVKLGTVICAAVNGFLISMFSKLLERHFRFENRFRAEKLFQ